MAKLTTQQIFGSNALLEVGSRPEDPKSLHLRIDDYQDTAAGGEILNGLGLDKTTIDPATIDQKAEAIFYALILLITQHQAARFK